MKQFTKQEMIDFADFCAHSGTWNNQVAKWCPDPLTTKSGQTTHRLLELFKEWKKPK